MKVRTITAFVCMPNAKPQHREKEEEEEEEEEQDTLKQRLHTALRPALQFLGRYREKIGEFEVQTTRLAFQNPLDYLPLAEEEEPE